MNKITISLIIVIALSLLISCGQQKSGWDGSIVEIDGVTVVNNPKEPIYGEDALTLEEDLVIGEVVDEAEPPFLLIRTFKVDDEENIYVLDYKDHKIKIFDKTGQLINAFGKQGPGPGELERPTNIELFPGNKIIVFNMGGRKLSLFTRTGEYIKDFSIEKYGFMQRVRVDSQGTIYGYYILREEKSQIIKVDKFDANLNFISNMVTNEKKQDFSTLEVLSPPFYYHVINDNFVWGHASEYVLHIVNPDGNEVQRIIRSYDPIKVTENEKEKIKKSFAKMPPSIKLKFPDAYPAFDWFYPGDKGGIVVRTYEKSEDGSNYFDFFDADGRYIAKIPFKYFPRAWRNDKVYFVEEDEDGYQLIKRYKFVWKF